MNKGIQWPSIPTTTTSPKSYPQCRLMRKKNLGEKKERSHHQNGGLIINNKKGYLTEGDMIQNGEKKMV